MGLTSGGLFPSFESAHNVPVEGNMSVHQGNNPQPDHGGSFIRVQPHTKEFDIASWRVYANTYPLAARYI